MLSEKFIKKMKNILLAQKNEISFQMKKEIGIDVDGDETDEIQGNMILSINKQFFNRNAEKIHQIDEALDKIESNEYGLCEDCGEEIVEKRLLINPYFTTCVICAEIREKEQNQRKRAVS
jgi:DnaK suppressor protein